MTFLYIFGQKDLLKKELVMRHMKEKKEILIVI